MKQWLAGTVAATSGPYFRKAPYALLRIAKERFVGQLAIGIAAVTWLLWLSSPFLLLGPLAYVRANEFGDAHYPQTAYLVEMLRAGQFSFWQPAQSGGTDLLGSFNAPPLSIFLFVIFPPWLAYNLIFLIVTTLASVSTYVLLRKSFNCVAWIACLGAAAFTSWFLAGGLVWAYQAGPSFALAPFILHWLLNVRDWSLKKIVLSAVLGFAFSLGGNFWAWTMFILGMVFFCAMVVAPQRIVRWLPHLAVIFLVSAAVQLPVLQAIIQTGQISGRQYYPPPKTSIDQGLWTYLADMSPHFLQNSLFGSDSIPYYEVAAGASVLAALVVFLAPSRWATFKEAWPVWTLSALFALLPIIDRLVIYLIGVFPFERLGIFPSGGFDFTLDSRMRFGRMFLPCVALALAMTLYLRIILMPDIRNVLSKKNFRPFQVSGFRFSKLLHLGLALIVVVFAAEGLARWTRDMRAFSNTLREQAIDGMNFSSFYLHRDLQTLASANPAFGTYRVATVQLYGSDSDFMPGVWNPPRDPSLFAPFLNVYGFETADGYNSNPVGRSLNYMNMVVVGPPDYPRSEFDANYKRKFVHPEQSFAQKLYLFEPLNSKTFDRDGCIRTVTPIDFSANYNLNMLSLGNVSFVVSGIPLSDSRLRLLSSETREELRALQCAPHSERIAAFRNRGLTGRPLYIYRNTDVLPRVSAPHAVQAVPDDAALYAALTQRSTQELASTALVVKSEVPAAVADEPTGLRTTIKSVTTVRGDHLAIATDSEASGLIVVSNSFSPYWQASAEGSALPIFPVYRAFIGIWVPPGEHQIHLRYRPPYSHWLGSKAGPS
jgi:hypothetical protein